MFGCAKVSELTFSCGLRMTECAKRIVAVFEGINVAGKSTQMKMLETKLRNAGLKHRCYRFLAKVWMINGTGYLTPFFAIMSV